jgi:hypothetical protein
MGAGAKRLSAVRWGVAGNIVFMILIPASAAVAALWWPIRWIFGVEARRRLSG